MTYLQERADRIIINSLIADPKLSDLVAIPKFYSDKEATTLIWTILQFKKEQRRPPKKVELIENIDWKRCAATEQEIEQYLSLDPIDETELKKLTQWWRVKGMIFEIVASDNLDKNLKTELAPHIEEIKANRCTDEIETIIEKTWHELCSPKYVKKKEEIPTGDIMHPNGLRDYIRVGTKYFYIGNNKLIPWDSKIINTDFAQGTRNMPADQKFEEFTNVISYTEDITNVGLNYNMFKQPKWPTPAAGEWPTIHKLIHKVFAGAGENQYEVGLDWIQLILTQPKQKVRALVLGSSQREVGKDTFGYFMKLLVGANNYNMIEVDEFLETFNDQFASKHIIFINEVEIDRFNQAAKNKLKNYITQDTVVINGKFAVKATIPYFGRLIIATNNIDNFMGIDDEENRFWMRIMPELLKSDKDPEFFDKLEAEIPHFLHFILNRSLYQPKKLGRFWHSEEQVSTAALEKVKKNSKTNLYLELAERFEYILSNETKGEIHFTALSLKEYLNNPQLTAAAIRNCLEKEFRLEQGQKGRRYDFFEGRQTNSRHYTFCSSSGTPQAGQLETLGLEID